MPHADASADDDVGGVVIPMIWAAAFFLAFYVVVIGAVVFIARGRSGTTITGPRRRDVNYDNPYGLGAYFWTNRRLPQGPSRQDQVHAATDDAGGTAGAWYGFAYRAGPTAAGEDSLPDRLPLDTAYRAAYYMVEQYAALEPDPDQGLARFLEYMYSHPARWDDWKQSVLHALRAARANDPLMENLGPRE